MRNPYLKAGGNNTLDVLSQISYADCGFSSVHGEYVAVFGVYLDESGTHTQKQLIVAGCVAHVDKWAQFSTAWNLLLKQYGLRWFHMKEFTNGNAKAFRHLSPTEKRDLLGKLTHEIKRTVLFGVVTFGKPDEYDRLTTQSYRSFHQSCYTYCASACVSMAIRRLRSPGVVTERLGVFIEQSDNHAQFLEVLAKFKRQTDPIPSSGDEWDGSGLLPPFMDENGQPDPFREKGVKIPAFGVGSKDSMPPLQVADIIAYCCHSQAMRSSRKEKLCTNVLCNLTEAFPTYAYFCTPETISNTMDMVIQAQHERDANLRQTHRVIEDLRDAGFGAAIVPYKGLYVTGNSKQLRQFLSSRGQPKLSWWKKLIKWTP